MTSEHLLVVEPSDIRSLRIVCRTCHAAVSFRLDETLSLPAECPGCRSMWWDQVVHTTGPTAFNELIRGLKNWLRTERELKTVFQVQFEFSDVRLTGPRD